MLKRLGEVPVSKKPAQEELDVELLVDAFKKSYSVCPNSLILSKDQLKVFAKDKWKEKDSAEISRQINPNQDTRWLGRLIKAGIVESDGAGTSFRVVKELVIDTIGKAFENKEAPN